MQTGMRGAHISCYKIHTGKQDELNEFIISQLEVANHEVLDKFPKVITAPEAVVKTERPPTSKMAPNSLV
jgi:hypothetical protein